MCLDPIMFLFTAHHLPSKACDGTRTDAIPTHVFFEKCVRGIGRAFMMALNHFDELKFKIP